MAPGADARRATAARAASEIIRWLDAGERVAFITLGDPNVYSTFSAIADEVRQARPAVPIETVPGIMAFQDLAARTGTVLLDGAQTLTLVTALNGPGDAAAALADPTRAVVVYKGGRHVPGLAKALADVGRLHDAVLGELLGLPGQQVTALAPVADRPASYLATVIVPPATPGATAGDGEPTEPGPGAGGGGGVSVHGLARGRPISSRCGARLGWARPTWSSGRRRSSPRPCSATPPPTRRCLTPRP